jgi:hypothetical protein
MVLALGGTVPSALLENWTQRTKKAELPPLRQPGNLELLKTRGFPSPPVEPGMTLSPKSYIKHLLIFCKVFIIIILLISSFRQKIITKHRCRQLA